MENVIYKRFAGKYTALLAPKRRSIGFASWRGQKEDSLMLDLIGNTGGSLGHGRREKMMGHQETVVGLLMRCTYRRQNRHNRTTGCPRPATRRLCVPSLEAAIRRSLVPTSVKTLEAREEVCRRKTDSENRETEWKATLRANWREWRDCRAIQCALLTAPDGCLSLASPPLGNSYPS